MAGRRVAPSSDMDVLLQGQGICDQDVEALLTSAASFLGVQSLASSGDPGSNSSLGEMFYEPVLNVEEICDDALEECLQQPEKKRRLTSGQVQSLEKTFELENKLEPERKVQLARDLGLHPRQVAIWFQNRRARWKTKQLEKDYEALKSSFDALQVEHDKLLREKEELEAQVLALTSRILSKDKDIERFQLFESIDVDQSLVCDQFRSTNVDGSVRMCNQQQQDVGSANSGMLDVEGGEHSKMKLMMMMEPTSCSSNNTFEPDQSDLSQVDAEILSMEHNSSNYEFQLGDQAFWSWP